MIYPSLPPCVWGPSVKYHFAYLMGSTGVRWTGGTLPRFWFLSSVRLPWDIWKSEKLSIHWYLFPYHYTCLYVYIHEYMYNVYMHTCMCIIICMSIYIHIYIYMYAYINIFTSSASFSLCTSTTAWITSLASKAWYNKPLDPRPPINHTLSYLECLPAVYIKRVGVKG
jgi:hypothetical protein